MSRLDQLLFTWQDGSFRAVAATGELAEPRGWLAEQTLRLCRYHPPTALESPEEAPISYGWWTEGPTRWLFRRGYLGSDPTGRPGNFFAHIVVGERHALPVHELAERFASPFWWSGGPAPSSFGPIELADISATPVHPAGQAQLESFVTTLLHTRGMSCAVIYEPPANIVACVASTCRRLPGLLDDLQFSTYETPQHADAFHLVGMHPSQNPPHGALVHGTIPATKTTSAGRILVSDRSDHQDVTRILLAAATADGSDGAVDRLAASLPSIENRRSDLHPVSRRLNIADRLNLLRSAAGRQVDEQVIAALLDSDPPDLLHIADDRTLPVTWRARALATRLTTASAPVRPVLERLRDVAGLGPATAQALPTSEPLIRALNGQTATTVRHVVLATIEGFSEDDRILLTQAALRVWEPARRPVQLAWIFERIQPSDERWDLIASDVVLGAIKPALERRQPTAPLSSAVVTVLTDAGGPRSTDLLAVVGGLLGGVQARSTSAGEHELRYAVDAVATIADRHRRGLLAELALAVLPAVPAGQECISGVVAGLQHLRHFTDDQLAGELLKLADRSGHLSPLPYIAFVIKMVGEKRLELTRGGIVAHRHPRLKNHAWQKLAVQAALRLNDPDRHQAAMLARNAGDRAERWWMSLNE
ncbi:hypothetical protein [Phytoactinopolyspora endophytica]|uniref:GAP1-N2 domain-containing protein n=1 Tax=Phytoactinopolyspora endophytica TaxID=1642495 RepID=UPI00101B64AF|nr:hypothetical protein [Phytoactinopolyspora endophytica]